MRNQTTTQTGRTSKGCVSKTKTCSALTKSKANTSKTTNRYSYFKNTRPKTMVLTVERTASGYRIQEATLLNKVNQYSARPVSVDTQTIIADINKKGFIA